MTQPEMNIDSGLTFREVQRRAERVQHRAPEISMANTLIELLGEVRHIRHALTVLNEGTALFSGAATNEPRESRSSVEIKTSTRGVDVTTKAYDGSDVGALVGPAVDAYFAALEQVQARVNGTAA